MRIVVDDLSGPQIAEFIGEHLDEMQAVTPQPRSRHALTLSGLREPGVTLWSAIDQDTIVGCAAIKSLDAKHAELKSMRTAPQRRGSGIASVLLEHIIAEADRMGFTRLSLETGSGEFFQPARSLYEKFGFTYCDPFATYCPDPNSIFMTRCLLSTVLSAKSEWVLKCSVKMVMHQGRTRRLAASQPPGSTEIICCAVTNPPARPDMFRVTENVPAPDYRLAPRASLFPLIPLIP